VAGRLLATGYRLLATGYWSRLGLALGRRRRRSRRPRRHRLKLRDQVAHLALQLGDPQRQLPGRRLGAADVLGGLRSGALLDLARAGLGRLDDRLHPLGRDAARTLRYGLMRAHQLVNRVPDRAEVPFDLLLVEAAQRG